jgi:amino acid transporter
MADAISFGVMVSAFASALGTATAGSRMLFALCRDGFLSRRLGETSDRTGSPANALVVVMVIAIVAFVAQRLQRRSKRLNHRTVAAVLEETAGVFGTESRDRSAHRFEKSFSATRLKALRIKPLILLNASSMGLKSGE